MAQRVMPVAVVITAAQGMTFVTVTQREMSFSQGDISSSES